MNRIIDAVKQHAGCYVNNKIIYILCYADDTVLIADNEDDLQRLLHQFDITTTAYDMEISTNKTKSMVITRDPIRNKLEVRGAIIEQVISFNYLGVEITSYKHLVVETTAQTKKATRIAGCPKDTIWRNRYMT